MKEILTSNKLTAALIKSVSGRYAVYAVQLISMMVLARLFTPETFGVFAVIQVFAIFFVLFSEMGLGPALINEKEISQKKLSDLIGVSVVTINSWCNQKSQPSIRTLFEISKILKTTPDKLVNNKIG